MWLTQKEVAELKAKYPAGTRIRLEQMNDPCHPVEPGTEGSVHYVDDAGQIHMIWDNGRSLALIPGVDSFRKTGDKIQNNY